MRFQNFGGRSDFATVVALVVGSTRPAHACCQLGGSALTLTLTPSGGGRYYLIAPIAAGYTGSLGTDSTGTERPDGSPSCTNDRALAPCP